MKLCNFAAFDPTHQKRGVSGLTNSSQADRAIWDEFNSNWSDLAVESERASRGQRGEKLVAEIEDPSLAGRNLEATVSFGGSRTETERVLRIRLGQAFFRSTVLASYGHRCCVCDLPCRSLLVASHIVPWAIRPDLRVNPRNGLCLCAPHDKAFDRGLISLDDQLAILVSRRLEEYLPHIIVDRMFVVFRGNSMRFPEKFGPSVETSRTKAMKRDWSRGASDFAGDPPVPAVGIRRNERRYIAWRCEMGARGRDILSFRRV